MADRQHSLLAKHPGVESGVVDGRLVTASIALLDSLRDAAPKSVIASPSKKIEENVGTDDVATIEAEEDPETQWRRLASFLNGAGSRVLGHWLALFEMHNVWSRRDPAVQASYMPRRKRRQKRSLKNPKMGLFFVALKNDCHISRTTAYRDLGYARTLVERFGREFVFGLLGTRLANDDHFLRDLVRLNDVDQGKQVVEVYIRGAGEQKAKAAIELYLGVQADREELGAEPDADELPNETLIPWTLAVGERVGARVPRRGDLGVGIRSVDGSLVTGYLAVASPTPTDKPDPFRRVLPRSVPLTFESSLGVAAQVVGELRRPYLQRVVVTPVRAGRAIVCRRCGEAWFWMAHSNETGTVWRCKGCHTYDELTARPGRDPKARLRSLRRSSPTVRKETLDHWERFLSREWDRRPRFAIQSCARNLRSPRHYQDILVDGGVAVALCWRNVHDEHSHYPISAIDLTIVPVAHSIDTETIEIGRPWRAHWTTESIARSLRGMLRRILERDE